MSPFVPLNILLQAMRVLAAFDVVRLGMVSGSTGSGNVRSPNTTSRVHESERSGHGPFIVIGKRGSAAEESRGGCYRQNLHTDSPAYRLQGQPYIDDQSSPSECGRAVFIGHSSFES